MRVIQISLSVFCFSWVAVSGPIDDVLGVSARVKSMGGAGSVLAEDFSAAFYNPANLPRCGANKISLGYDFIDTHLEAQEQLGAYNQASLGACLSPIKNLGVGFYASTGLGVPVDLRIRTSSTDTRSLLYSHALRFPSIIAGLGYRIIPELSVGVSTSIHIKGDIDLGISLPINSSNNFAMSLNMLAAPSLSWIVGVTYEPIVDLRSSFVFRSPSYSTLHIESQAEGSFWSLPSAALKFHVDNALDFSPMQFGLGVSYKPIKNLNVGVDATYYRWSTAAAPFIEAREDPASPGWAGNVNFKSEGVFIPRDTIVPRFGIEYTKDDVALRVGYAFLMSPTGEFGPETYVYDNSVHRTTFGLGYHLPINHAVVMQFDAALAVDVMPRLNGAGGTTMNAGLTTTVEY